MGNSNGSKRQSASKVQSNSKSQSISEKKKPSKSKKMREVKFKIHIAIDFGTDGCGLAFAYKDNVRTYDRFRGRTQRTNKTKTHILLNADNEVSTFGNNAKFSYLNLGGREKSTWKYFERFKMSLYENSLINSDIERKVDKVDIADTLKAANGIKVPSEVVFVAAFKSLQKLAIDFLPKITKETIDDDDIQWILTVPAIWSESAKDKMKKWIIKSGLVDAYIKDQCIIAYEPDCAALAIRKAYLNRRSALEKDKIIDEFDAEYTEYTMMNPTDDPVDENDVDELKYGDKYILIDAGGGTVDIACHQITDDGTVEEIVHPTGDKWGSCYIDDLYIKLLEEIFSKEWMDEFKEEEPTFYMDVQTEFQAAKLSFYENAEDVTHPVEVPLEFIQFLEEKCRTKNTTPEKMLHHFCELFDLGHIRQLVGARYHVQCGGSADRYKEQDYEQKKKWQRESKNFTLELSSKNDKNKFKDNQEYLRMDMEIWKALFDSQIDEIIGHVKELLWSSAFNRKCDYVCLVGGFSGSLYFQHRIKEELGGRVLLIIPQKPILAVVRGAAWMGLEKHYVGIRKLKYTYGIQMYFDKKRAKDCGISDEYIKNNMSRDGFVRDCFKIVTHKNECVSINQVIPNIGYKRSNQSLIPILYSNDEEPKTANDGIPLATLVVPHFDDNREVITEFHFGGTTFKVEAYAKSNEAERKTVEIRYVK